MADKKITELVRATNVENTDLLLLETNNGTRSISYKDLTKTIDENIDKATEPHPFANNAAAHNGIFRGKDLKYLGVEEICKRISNGTFEDLYIGDYFDITISTSYGGSEVVRCILAGFNIYINNGNVAVTKNHAVIVPKNCFKTTAKMNTTSTTGKSSNTLNTSDLKAYAGCDMHNIVLPVYADAIRTVIGESHLLRRKSLLTKDVSETLSSMAGGGFTGASSDYDWYDVELQLLSEIQVYGSNICSSSSYDVGLDNLQLPLFALDPTTKICGTNGKDSCTTATRKQYWLRNVVSHNRFANVNHWGVSASQQANDLFGVRPFFCIC